MNVVKHYHRIRDSMRPKPGFFGVSFFSEIVTMHRINKQFSPVCWEFFGKFNETNGNFLALFLKKLIGQNERFSPGLQNFFTVLLYSVYWSSYLRLKNETIFRPFSVLFGLHPPGQLTGGPTHFNNNKKSILSNICLRAHYCILLFN